MKHAHSITSLLLKLFLVGSSQIFCASWAQAQSSSLSELGAVPEDSLSASPPWQQLLSDLSSSEDFEHVAWQDYEEDLEEMAQHPVNLNTATREELERMPFLTASQVEDILFYIYRYGQLKSMSELTLISSIGWYQRQLMSCFFYVADDGSKPAFPSLKTIAQYGKHEVMGMLKVPFYERKGDASGTGGYLGYPYKHGLRYLFRYGNSVKLGFVASQDAGEPFFGGRNTMGYDFYSFYLQVKNLGRWKNITLGRYRLNEGLGLILNNDFGFGKLSALTSLGRSSSCIIRGHSSRSSANYLQGAAATYTLLKGLELTGFLSYRQIDATLSADGGGIKTILKTGLHRTVNEIAKQKVASNTLVGGNISYRHQGWHIGGTAFYTSFSLPLTPNKSQLYKRFAPEGNAFWNASISYGYISHRLTLSGETATGDCGSIATLNAASYLCSDHFTLMALHRFYSARYYSLFSNSFSEGSDVQDENGVYLGFTWIPALHWSITAYSDFAYFAWPKYQTRESTQSWDNLVNILFQPSRVLTVGGRFRYKDKAGTTTGRLRLYATISQKRWSAKTSFDYTMSQAESTMKNEGDELSKGYMVSEHIGWEWKWKQLKGTLRGCLGYFHTSDFASRIYAYEPGLLYQMSFGSYYGEGIRYALVARSEIGSHLLLIAKLGTTDYFDRSHISSGLQEISRSSQTDLEIQVKWKW
ncbi:MAG TPA: DNA-binding protein [Prevotella sp.]|nr:DNA-binding protein [Prevotella sp.]